MREFKFRAWLKESKEMYEVDFLGKNVAKLVGGEWENIDDLVIMQYTGLKDSFGNEIYEGDIIEIHYDEDLTTKPFDIGVVKYQIDDDYLAFDLEPYMDVEMNALSWLKCDSDPSVKYFEVVGNIYENPELICEKND